MRFAAGGLSCVVIWFPRIRAICQRCAFHRWNWSSVEAKKSTRFFTLSFSLSSLLNVERLKRQMRMRAPAHESGSENGLGGYLTGACTSPGSWSSSPQQHQRSSLSRTVWSGAKRSQTPGWHPCYCLSVTRCSSFNQPRYVHVSHGKLGNVFQGWIRTVKPLQDCRSGRACYHACLMNVCKCFNYGADINKFGIWQLPSTQLTFKNHVSYTAWNQRIIIPSERY